MRHLLHRLADENTALHLLREQFATAFERGQHHRIEALGALVAQHESTVETLTRQFRDATLRQYLALKDRERQQFAAMPQAQA